MHLTTKIVVVFDYYTYQPILHFFYHDGFRVYFAKCVFSIDGGGAQSNIFFLKLTDDFESNGKCFRTIGGNLQEILLKIQIFFKCNDFLLFLFQPNFRECFDNSGIVLKYVTNRNFDFPSFFLDRNPFGGAVCTTCPTAGYATLHVPLKKIDADINNMISEHSRFLHKQTIIGFV